MTLWLMLTILAAAAAAIVAVPFLFRGKTAGGGASSLDVYKDQLEEVDRDKAQGLIDEAEAKLARVEIERRILAAGRSDGAAAETIDANWQYRTVTAIATIVVLGSVGLYGTIGQPNLFQAQQQALVAAGEQGAGGANAAQQPIQAGGGDVAAMVKRLEDRLKTNPNDPEGWRVLGWSYYNTGRYKESVDAYRHSVELQKDNPVVKALYGEAMVKAAGDTVTDEALKVFDDVIAINPNDERARFFRGVARAQKGDSQGAIDEWMELYKVAPADAEWVADLRTRIEETAQQAGIDVREKLAAARPDTGKKPTATASAEAAPAAPATPGPTPEDIENAKTMSKEDQHAMVSTMVDRLAGRLESSPKDADGWIMLIRSRMAMNDADKARAALAKAKTVFADEPETQKRIVQAAQAMGITVNE